MQRHAFDDVLAIDTIAPRTTGVLGRLDITCPTAWASISGTQFKDFHFREVTGHVENPLAWKFFRDISEGRYKVELARKLRMVKRTPLAHLLFAETSPERNGAIHNAEGIGKRAIGWAVLDRDILPKENVLCAAIVTRVLEGVMKAEQHVVECVILAKKNDDEDSSVFQRIGCGRVVEQDWLDGSMVETVSIV